MTKKAVTGYLSFFSIICCIVFNTVPANAEEKSEAVLLQETVALAQEIKRFEPMIGIKPSDALSKSTLDTKAHSLISLFIQKNGTIATNTPIDITITISFPLPEKGVPIEHFQAYNENYSTYYRQAEQFSSDEAVITVQFAKELPPRKVMTIFHEDLHSNIEMPREDNEALTTPLGYLAAMIFFEYKNDQQNLQTIKEEVKQKRTIYKELNALVKELEIVFKTLLYQEEGFTKALELLHSFPAYEEVYNRQIKGQDAGDTLEAKISFDFRYWKYFDRVIALYEKKGSTVVGLYPKIDVLKNLIEEMKIAPKNHAALEEYLTTLEKKYERPTGK